MTWMTTMTQPIPTEGLKSRQERGEGDAASPNCRRPATERSGATALTPRVGRGCAAVAVLMPDYTVTKVVAASCGLLGAWAGTEAGLGRCVSFKILMPMLAVFPWGTACYA